MDRRRVQFMTTLAIVTILPLLASPSLADVAQAAADTPSPGVTSPGIGKHQHNGPDGEADINVCSDAVPPGVARCFARVRTDAAARSRRPVPNRVASPAATSSTVGNQGAYDPAYLQSAYDAPSVTGGTGQTVAVVDAFGDPNAEADLNVYRSTFNLPSCTTSNGCFRKVDQNGGSAYPPPDAGWAQETSVDVDMVSALCPNCKILLVEGNTDALSDLGTGVNTAVALGANAVSNSYGAPESEVANEASIDSTTYYQHAGVAVTVATGDGGYGAQFPAASQFVTAVGGTTLTQLSNTGARNGSESAWSGGGSGCSSLLPKPSWQSDTGCANRTEADVAAVADPATGVWAYDTYQQSGFTTVGGTSVATPIVASMYALRGNAASANTEAAYPYGAPAGALNDVTTGSNGTCTPSYLCTAGRGYDGPTGLGSPNGTAAFGPPPPPPPPNCTTFSSPATGSHQVCGAIRTKYLALGGPSGFLGYPVTNETRTPDGVGRFNHFANAGSIYWTPSTGAWSIHGAIRAKWARMGWERSLLGYPVSDETGVPNSVGRFNRFSRAGSIYWTPSTGAWSIHGAIRTKYLALGGPSGFLGYPVTDETGTPDGVGRFNHFSNSGSIYWTRPTGAWSVHGAIRSRWASMGWERSCLGYPVSDEFGDSRVRQSNFQRGTITFSFLSAQTTSSC